MLVNPPTILMNKSLFSTATVVRMVESPSSPTAAPARTAALATATIAKELAVRCFVVGEGFKGSSEGAIFVAIMGRGVCNFTNFYVLTEPGHIPNVVLSA